MDLHRKLQAHGHRSHRIQPQDQNNILRLFPMQPILHRKKHTLCHQGRSV